MKLTSLKIKWFKNLDFWDNPIDFTESDWISIFVWNNGSGKSNVLEAISAIFYGLFDETNERRCDFSYMLEYNINWNFIQIQQLHFKWKADANWKLPPEIIDQMPDAEVIKIVSCYINRKYVEWNLNSFYLIPKGYTWHYLPSQIIALYSWEETRLYEDYYRSSYEDFLSDVNRWKCRITDNVKMIFINRNYWNIALLTMFVSDVDLNSIIWNIGIQTISLRINTTTLAKFQKNPNEVTNFVQALSTLWDVDLEWFKDQIHATHRELYNLLSAAYLPSDDNHKLIYAIDITFNNWVNANCLSEWEKKQILLYFVTKVLADKDSIILLDEPDSYIHVGNKHRLKEFMTEFLDVVKEWEFIMTTHSPTLMHKFDKKHLFYLENGKLCGKGKREILDHITDWQMSMSEMEIFLNSDKKFLLATEWITDKKHIELAIEKLWIEDKYDIYTCDWADKLKQFLVGLPKNFFKKKIVVWIFDFDQEWLKQIKHVGDELEKNKHYKVKDRENIYWLTLPCPNINFEVHENCPIEFMYTKEILQKNNMISKRSFGDINRYIINDKDKLNQAQIDKKQELFYYKISESNTSKNDFTEKVKDLKPYKFNNFKTLFQKIDSIDFHPL